MNILKYFKKPAVIMNKDRWKYNLAKVIKSMFYSALIIVIASCTVAMFIYALITPDYL